MKVLCRTQDVAQDVPQDAAKDVAQDAAQDAAKDVAKDVAQDVVQDLVHTAFGGAAQSASMFKGCVKVKYSGATRARSLCFIELPYIKTSLKR